MTMARHLRPFRDFRAMHFRWQADGDGRIATITRAAEPQAICMQTADFRRAYDAFGGRKTAGIRR